MTTTEATAAWYASRSITRAQVPAYTPRWRGGYSDKPFNGANPIPPCGCRPGHDCAQCNPDNI
ncbi:hypothetical protein [Quatrionicoccus australiensis]|uniref:hypothetical protein n=1 Tax=Quatrionicoccus australiensis TaxID=138118 RepID=UPI001CFA91EE|nr:hypothetical protein [Quatrionicoccus australiensis]MCB4359580.1 hypothetical protein [Quatrionicoccus australiensis]